MFASLIIVVPFLPLAQAEYHPRPGITILAARFSRCRYSRASFSSTLVDLLYMSKHSVAFSASKDTIFSPWSTAQGNVLVSAPFVALGPGLSRPQQNLRGLFFFLRMTKCLLDFIVHMALIICLNSRMNTSTEFRPVFICTASVASLHITTCCL